MQLLSAFICLFFNKFPQWYLSSRRQFPSPFTFSSLQGIPDLSHSSQVPRKVPAFRRRNNNVACSSRWRCPLHLPLLLQVSALSKFPIWCIFGLNIWILLGFLVKGWNLILGFWVCKKNVILGRTHLGLTRLLRFEGSYCAQLRVFGSWERSILNCTGLLEMWVTCWSFWDSIKSDPFRICWLEESDGRWKWEKWYHHHIIFSLLEFTSIWLMHALSN